MLWNEVSEYRIANLIAQGKFTKEKPLEILNEKKEPMTLFLKGHPTYEKLISNAAKQPVQIIEASRYGFFGGFATYMAKVGTKGDLGVSLNSEVDEHGLAPVKWKMYDYTRDPYKDPDIRGKFSIVSFLPVASDSYRITEDGFHVEIDEVALYGNSIRVNFNSDLYYAVRSNILIADILLVKNSILEVLL